MQNKCIRFCLKLDRRKHIGFKEFKEIDWLPTKYRVDQCISTMVFKFHKNMSPTYISSFLEKKEHSNTRYSYLGLKLPLCKTNAGKNSLSYIGPAIWNKIPSPIKNIEISVNTFKHKIKKFYLTEVEKNENEIYVF